MTQAAYDSWLARTYVGATSDVPCACLKARGRCQGAREDRRVFVARQCAGGAADDPLRVWLAALLRFADVPSRREA